MACSTEIRFRKPLSWVTIKKTIIELTQEKFGSEFTIDKDKDGIYIGFNQNVWGSPNLTTWPRYKGGKIKVLEFSDNRFLQDDNGWFACWLSSAIAAKFNGKHYSESSEEVYKSDFHIKYPNLYSWRVRRDGFLIELLLKAAYKSELKTLKANLPKTVYDVFAQRG